MIRIHPIIYGARVRARLTSPERRVVYTVQHASGQLSPASVTGHLSDDRDTVEPILRDLSNRGYLHSPEADRYTAPDSQAIVGFRVVG